VGAPYLRINFGALPEDVKNVIGPKPDLTEKRVLEDKQVPPDLDLD
jgi:hypothetical protein